MRPLLRAAAFAAYTALGCLAAPFLFLSPRLRQGWRQRLGLGLPGPCRIWIQGASAGECQLIQSLMAHLPAVSTLATTCTAQGLSVLEKTAAGGPFHPRMLPLDLPPLMYFTLKRIRPAVVVLLETELWPGLLMACAMLRVPVVVLNARMSSRSLGGYLFLRPLLPPPAAIGAISPGDALRFGLVFGHGSVRVTGNIKFDRAMNAPLLERRDNPLRHLIPEDDWFVVLGSVREEEEEAVLALVRTLRELRPACIVGLFPRHMHRTGAWLERLATAGIPAVLRSGLNGPARPGTVVVWDRFGELGAAYGLAGRAFVGGSLAQLGGQNFLEPLSQGVLPATGPHTRNFDWVGPEIFVSLVRKNGDIGTLARELTMPAPPRAEVRSRAEAYIAARAGASQASASMLGPFLK